MDDVLIVGTGPTGLTMAVELVRHKIPFRIVGKAVRPVPSSESRAIGIVPRTLEVFEMMGIAGPIMRTAHQLRKANVFIGEKRIGQLKLDDLDTRYPVAILPQGDTERILSEHLAEKGVVIEREVELTELTQQRDFVTARLRYKDGREEVIHTRWLIGCDGQHSTVRDALGATFIGQQYEEVFVLADVHLESKFPRDESYAFLHPSGVLNLFPLTNNLVRVVAVLDDIWRSRIPDKPTLSDFQALVNERGPGGIRLIDSTWISRFKISRHMVEQFRHGHVFLAGDAAHVHSPAGGQGMNTGIQDSHNLAWKLALVISGKSPDSLLDSYHAEREPVARQVTKMTDRNTKLAIPRNPLVRGILNLVLSWVLGIKSIEHRMSSSFAELNIDYGNSPIIAGDQKVGVPSKQYGLSAGIRVPDIQLTIDGSEKPVRLFELLRRPQHILLLFAGDTPTSENHEKVTNVTEVIRRKYSDRIRVHIVVGTEELKRLDRSGVPWQYLVRPDGYIGFRGPLEIDQLEQYLCRIFHESNSV